MAIDKSNLKILKLSDKDFYNHFFKQHVLPSSDYCFSVVFSWLVEGGDVKYIQLTSDLIALYYTDVLDNQQDANYMSLIGNPIDIDADIYNLLIDEYHLGTRVVLTEPHMKIASKFVSGNFRFELDKDLTDYLYPVSEHATWEAPDYRRLRRELRTFQRIYENPEVEVEEIELDSYSARSYVANVHHIWDNTFRFNNDPDRTEGLVIDRILRDAPELGVRALTIKVSGKPEGLMIFTEIAMSDAKYADLHHARFSYKHKFISDVSFHEFAKFLGSETFDYINFERDAGVEGLRNHKLLLKPKKVIQNFTLTTG